ncbi:MAG: phosphate ABC transporter permease subunit PstC [Ktedonobacterales bacterium]|nr:phosphate ABC transporter permease subunit PstC [Ktedonobacterales bacterium]
MALGDFVLQNGTLLIVIAVLALIAGVFWVVLASSMPTIHQFGWQFLTNQAFDPDHNSFGVGPAIFGTIVTSVFALVFAAPLGIGAAVFLVEFCPRRARTSLAFFTDLLATVPSVVFGLWGFLVLAPWMQHSGEPWLKLHLGFLPFFVGTPRGVGLLTAGMILTVMILPLVIAIAREVMQIVPNEQREALLALGATRWEVVRYAILPFARVGITGGVILALGRALGETIAVTLVIGNQANKISPDLFATGYTLPSVIANQFGEATPGLFRSAVIEAGLILIVMTLIVNVLARLLIARMGRHHRVGGLVA